LNYARSRLQHPEYTLRRGRREARRSCCGARKKSATPYIFWRSRFPYAARERPRLRRGRVPS